MLKSLATGCSMLCSEPAFASLRSTCWQHDWQGGLEESVVGEVGHFRAKLLTPGMPGCCVCGRKNTVAAGLVVGSLLPGSMVFPEPLPSCLPRRKPLCPVLGK